MALIKCSECGKEISDQAEICPNCGVKTKACQVKQANQETEKAINTASLISIVFVIIGIVLLGSSLITIFENLDKYSYWIKYGWADYSDVFSIGDVIKIIIGMFLISIGVGTPRATKDEIYRKTHPINNSINTWKCPNCGKDNPANFFFCSSCSCKKPRLKSISNTWTCRKCGTENSSNTRYCSKCEANKPVEVNNQEWTCPDCNKSNSSIYNTCQHCGSSRPRNTVHKSTVSTPQPAKADTETPTPPQQAHTSANKFCSNCGEKLQDGVKFCPSCGHCADQSQTSRIPSQDYIGQAREKARRAANTIAQKGSEAAAKARDYIDSKRQ